MTWTIHEGKPTTHEPLDTVIRAFDEGDGATINEHRTQIVLWLRELRRYREAISCSKCGRTVLGRDPICKGCQL